MSNTQTLINALNKYVGKSNREMKLLKVTPDYEAMEEYVAENVQSFISNDVDYSFELAKFLQEHDVSAEDLEYEFECWYAAKHVNNEIESGKNVMYFAYWNHPEEGFDFWRNGGNKFIEKHYEEDCGWCAEWYDVSAEDINALNNIHVEIIDVDEEDWGDMYKDAVLLKA